MLKKQNLFGFMFKDDLMQISQVYPELLPWEDSLGKQFVSF